MPDTTSTPKNSGALLGAVSLTVATAFTIGVAVAWLLAHRWDRGALFKVGQAFVDTGGVLLFIAFMTAAGIVGAALGRLTGNFRTRRLLKVALLSPAILFLVPLGAFLPFIGGNAFPAAVESMRDVVPVAIGPLTICLFVIEAGTRPSDLPGAQEIADLRYKLVIGATFAAAVAAAFALYMIAQPAQ